MVYCLVLFYAGDFPSRVITVVLGAASLALAAVLRSDHSNTFQVPLALTIVSTAWFIVAASVSGWVKYHKVPFCIRRTASLIIGDLVALGCCAACAALVSNADPSSNSTLRNILTVVQIVSILLLALCIMSLVWQWRRASKGELDNPPKVHPAAYHTSMPMPNPVG
ncbi:hypothetical protein VD0002_g4108 [Verticillium dahliae]|uniref:Uncharacterized protein n=1 Tax=Verticillium dahliae TaxID=27337 RepID=A0A2J8ESY6_VERDA|nr:hypothetical protein EV126DRAFT_453874 [Verticillium dahliae]PNH57006.1 hypothetical protein VD0003_g706 [Verticillium dahliae]PNH64618.1 hypothetical protein VD0002_g4108 [Verticillium dahliae]RXG49092.1 hypothetical protein VDGE_21325 [Verticillium dahliae]